MSNFKSFIVEEVFGHQAILYHRTGSQTEYYDLLRQAIEDIESYNETHEKEDHLFNSFSVIQNIVTHGFDTSKSNVGKMYGNGVYCTYDYDSQIRAVGNKNDMESDYGKIVIKSKCNLTNFLILDYQVAKKVYGAKYTLKDQCEKLGLTKVLVDLAKPKSRISLELADYTDAELAMNSNGEGLELSYPTSDIALCLYKYYFIHKKVSGIIFTGNHDGHVAIVYNPKLLVPYSFCITDRYEMVLPWVHYNRYFNRQLISTYVDALIGEFGEVHQSRMDSTKDIDKYEIVHADRFNKRWDNSDALLIKYRSKYGIIDTDGNIIIKPTNYNIQMNGGSYKYSIGNDFIVYKTEDKVGVLDSTGKVKIPIEYQWIGFTNGFYEVIDIGGRNSALFSLSGNQLSDFKFTNILGKRSFAICENNDGTTVIDSNGVVKIPTTLGKFTFKDGQFIVANESGMYLINSDWKKSDTYDEILNGSGRFNTIVSKGKLGIIESETLEEVVPPYAYDIDFVPVTKRSGIDEYDDLVHITVDKNSAKIMNLTTKVSTVNIESDYRGFYSFMYKNLGAIVCSLIGDSDHRQIMIDRNCKRILPQYNYFIRWRDNQNYFMAKKDFVEKDGKADVYEVMDDGEIKFRKRL